MIDVMDNFTNEMLTDLNSRVTRFEVIDLTSEAVESNFKEFSIPDMGRVLVKYGVSVGLSYQDDGTTLKVFLKELDK